MSIRRSLGVVAAPILVVAFIAVSRADPVQEADGPAPIVFVCRNGVAMSVWSAAYFNRLARERGLRQRAIARAALPTFDEVPLRMRFALVADGFRLDGYRPRVVDAEELRNAERLVVILPTEAPLDADTRAERWEGFPPMREQYFASRAALARRVDDLVSRLARDQSSTAMPSSSTSASCWKSAVTPKSAIVG